ncbi:AraC family transcriptional regulator [Cellvibrio zantedeschiae]|uniref:AraC family transcriptional regulator n=1 Tax=Cellvibrio zantedeschiae TaxID=1237077 RepID=A0ABQ3B2J4_9GAMM|nr:helix-turn-helix domain-containing protein [Cellvibrio zantedeschiae]GGY76834.1 AraC family transcriptional regulator [Cellvibrio zantedeschiae]
MSNDLLPGGKVYRVSLLVLPDAVISTVAGIYDVMNSLGLMAIKSATSATTFKVDIVGEMVGPLDLVSGVPFHVQRSIDSVTETDIVIVPSFLLSSGSWEKNRYPRLINWLRSTHASGAIICSACSGVFLLAETGLLDNKDATVHFNYADIFAATYPKVSIYPERVLVVSGQHEELISSGASMSWHDLVLYLFARFMGATLAQEVARLFALQWHQDGLTPYIVFEGKFDHGDAEIQIAQQWLQLNFSVANAVDQMITHSSLAERTFKRRFTAATGITPIEYVQRLRVEDAKRRLERTNTSIDEISWRVGYEDAAFFRRIFKRTTGLTPGAYRKRFCIPTFAR